MGTTAASLHIHLRYGKNPDQSEALLKAYARLGWAPPKKGETATRVARLARNATPFVSILDSDCEQLDDGTLKQLAALLSKELKTAAIVATVQDSDAFEFLLYFEGKQIDAVTDAANGLDADVKSLSGKRRATKWLEALGRAWALNLAGGPRATSAAGVEAFITRAKAIDEIDTPFSDHKLEAWCELAGLPAAAATATGDERESQGDVIARLELSARPVRRSAATQAAAETTAPAGRSLTYTFSADDHPYHRYFPAAWPMPPAATQGFSWGVVCRDGGIERFTLRVEIDRDGDFGLCDLSAQALPFYNGQVTSERILAAAERNFPRPEAVEAATFVLDAPEFHVPAPARGSRSQALLLLKARVQAGWRGEFTLKPTVIADGVELALPPLRVAVTVPDWSPRIAESPNVDLVRLVRVLRLNRPSVHGAVAILPGDGADALDRSRRLIERALAAMGRAETKVSLDAQKHLTPSQSLRLVKNHAEFTLEGLAAAPIWAKLFDPASDYQTARFGLTPAGAPWPYAGFSVQTSLREGRTREVFGGGPNGPTTAVALWAIADPQARDALGLNWTAITETFRDFMREAGALQGWLAECAWIPEFDTYEDFHQTPYENISPIDWFRSGRRGSLTGQLWSRRRLRFLAPRLWLGDDLAAAVDLAVLAETADVTPVREGLEVALKPGVDLRALERALWPILPTGL